VPEAQATARGSPEALARPRAKKPAQRSSTWEKQRRRGSCASVSTSGAERDPGEVHAALMPQRASSSANARSSRYVSVAVTKLGWRCAGERRPVARVRRHAPHLGRRRGGYLSPTLPAGGGRTAPTRRAPW